MTATPVSKFSLDYGCTSQGTSIITRQKHSLVTLELRACLYSTVRWSLPFTWIVKAWIACTGTGISVFGTMCDPGGNTTVSTFTIDNNGPSKFTVPSGIICNQNFVNFFNSPPLENGQHTLIITNLNQNAWFFLDYLQVIRPDLSSSENTIVSGSLSSTAASLTSSGTSTSLPASPKGTSKPISTGVILGTAFAAVAFVGILILSVTLWWRRQRQKVLTQALEIGRYNASCTIASITRLTVGSFEKSEIPGTLFHITHPHFSQPIRQCQPLLNQRCWPTYLALFHPITPLRPPTTSLLKIHPTVHYK